MIKRFLEVHTNKNKKHIDKYSDRSDIKNIN